MKTSRAIRKSSQYCAREAERLLQGLLTVELLRPSETLWLVSAWASDMPVLDNRTGSFAGLSQAWGHREIQLVEVLVELARRGSSVVVATNTHNHNRWFHDRLAALAAAESVVDRVRHDSYDKLHVKGLLGDDFHLRGSMNLTRSGVDDNEEELILEIDPAEVARARIEFENRFGR